MLSYQVHHSHLRATLLMDNLACENISQHAGMIFRFKQTCALLDRKGAI